MITSSNLSTTLTRYLAHMATEDWVLKTQAALNGLFTKPALKESTLQRPPLRFIHDIFTRYVLVVCAAPCPQSHRIHPDQHCNSSSRLGAGSSGTNVSALSLDTDACERYIIRPLCDSHPYDVTPTSSHFISACCGQPATLRACSLQKCSTSLLSRPHERRKSLGSRDSIAASS